MTKTVVNADRVAPGLFGDFDRLAGIEVIDFVGSGATYTARDEDARDEDADDEDARDAGSGDWLGVDLLDAGVAKEALSLLLERHISTFHALRRVADHASTEGLEGSLAVRNLDVRADQAVDVLLSATSKVAALTAELRVVDVVESYRPPNLFWPRFGQQTPVSGSFRSCVHLLKNMTPTDISTDFGPATISIVFSAGDIEAERLLDAELMQRLTDSAHTGTLAARRWRSVEHAAGGAKRGEPSVRFGGNLVDDDSSAQVDSDDLGTPSTTVLTGAVEDLRTWLSMTQHDVAEFVGISAQTVMSWKRDEPRFPRHRRIPALLSLWAAVSGAREALDASAVAKLVWGSAAADGQRRLIDRSDGREGAPVVPLEELTELLFDAATRDVVAASTEGDGYVPGTSSLPSREDFARAAREGRGDDDHKADVPRG